MEPKYQTLKRVQLQRKSEHIKANGAQKHQEKSSAVLALEKESTIYGSKQLCELKLISLKKIAIISFDRDTFLQNKAQNFERHCIEWI